ncbi:hypothetical protein BsWGS_15696 [Bradybaena similaris]
MFAGLWSQSFVSVRTIETRHRILCSSIVPDPRMMHFSLFGKHVNVSIPRRVPPVENGRGIIWEDAMLTSQSSFSLPVTPKSMFSTAESALVSACRAVFRPHLLTQGSRMIVVERPPIEPADPGISTPREPEDESHLSAYTEGTIHPPNFCDQDFIEEDTYHMGFGRAPEECTERGDHQEKAEESA